MILDAQNVFSDAQALTATADSTNLIDLSVANRQIGVGEPMCVLVNLTVLADATSSDETYTFQVETDDNESFSSSTLLGGATTITRGDAAGTRYVYVMPAIVTIERYIQVVYTLGGTTPTVTLDCHLLPLAAVQDNQLYADAITIS